MTELEFHVTIVIRELGTLDVQVSMYMLGVSIQGPSVTTRKEHLRSTIQEQQEELKSVYTASEVAS
jgi:hypothetical protein